VGSAPDEFAGMTTKWIKRSAHRSVRDLVASLRTWITNRNENPKPYVWHKTADEILNSPADYCPRISDSGSLGNRVHVGSFRIRRLRVLLCVDDQHRDRRVVQRVVADAAEQR
jgi:hypothetical protein